MAEAPQEAEACWTCGGDWDECQHDHIVPERSAAYQAVMAAPNVLSGNAWTNARIWRGVEAALDAAGVRKPSSSEGSDR